jgi:ribosomal protein S18 acetylase RimI-like enzyme
VVGEVGERAFRVDGFLEGEGGDRYAGELRDVLARVRGAVVLVAEDGDEGAVVGSVTLASPGTPFADIAAPGELEVRMLVVAPEARRRGIAEALMAAVPDQARALGRERIVLSTARMMTGAQRIYERLGYERRPERDWMADGFELLAYVLPVD